MAEDRKIIEVWQSKDNKSAITDYTPIKLHVHYLNMVIYIQYMLHEIPSNGYLVVAEDGKNLEIVAIKGQWLRYNWRHLDKTSRA